MGKFLVIFGVLITFGAAGFFIFSMFETDHPVIAGAIETLACEGSETLRIERNSWSLPNGEFGENITFFCDIEPGVGRDVTGMGVLFQGGIFTVLLLVGMMFIFAGAFRSKRSRKQAFQSQLQQQDFWEQGDGTAQAVNVHGDIENLPPQTRAMLENMLGGMITTVTSSGQQAASLTERLQQLDEAYQKNLISKAEYDKVRQAILDSMDD